MTIRAGLCGGLQPRRQDRPDRGRGRDGAALGRGDRQAPRSPMTHQDGLRRGLQPRRQDPPDRERGRDGAASGISRNCPTTRNRISTWVEVITGLGLDKSGSVNVLSNTTWHERREKLETLGGQPQAARRSLDPTASALIPPPAPRPGWSESAGQRPRPRSTRPSCPGRSTPPSCSSGLASSPATSGTQGRRRLQKGLQPRQSRTSAVDDLFQRLPLPPCRRGVGRFRRALLWASRGESLAKRQLWAEAAADCGKAFRLVEA